MTDRPVPGPIPRGIAPCPPGDPPIRRWEAENGRRRAKGLAAIVADLIRTGATTAEVSRALLPWLRSLSDGQCLMLERELDAVLADLAEDEERRPA